MELFEKYSTQKQSSNADTVYYLYESGEAMICALDAPNCRFQIALGKRDCGHGEKICGVVAVGKKGIGILEQAHRPHILFPFQQAAPVNLVCASIHTHMAVTIGITRLDHGGEEDRIPYAASVDRRAAYFCSLR